MAIWSAQLWMLLVPLAVASARRHRASRQRDQGYIYYFDSLAGSASFDDDPMGAFSGDYSFFDYSQEDPSRSSSIIQVFLTSDETTSVSVTEDDPVLSSQDDDTGIGLSEPSTEPVMTSSLIEDGDVTIHNTGFTSSFIGPRNQASASPSSTIGHRIVVADLQEARERRVFGAHFDIINRIRGRANDPGSYVDPRRQRELQLFNGLTDGRAGVDSDRLAEADNRSLVWARPQRRRRRRRDPSFSSTALSSSSALASVRRNTQRSRRVPSSISSSSSSTPGGRTTQRRRTTRCRRRQRSPSFSSDDPVLLYGNVLMRLTRRRRSS